MSLQSVIADRVLEIGSGVDHDELVAFAGRLAAAPAPQARALLAALGGLEFAADPVILPLLLEIGSEVERGPRSSRVAAYLNEIEEVDGPQGDHLWDLLGNEGCPILGYHHDEYDTLVLCDDGAAVVAWNSETRQWEVRLADIEDVCTLTRVGARL